MTDQPFDIWFEKVAGFPARDWQTELAQSETCQDRLIRIPTGFGKTLGVVAAWTFHRLVLQSEDWPRRLVVTLPMRVLVEQTIRVVQRFLSAAGLLSVDAGADVDGEGRGVAVHGLMGGVAAERWHLCPEQPAVLVGTQDMLLSRALNRGYASPRPRWPMEFGLLHHDALWVMDEVQLMGVGLTTSWRLQRLRSRLPSLRPTATWWMSATLQPKWFEHGADASTVDELAQRTLRIDASARTGGLFDIRKSLAVHTIEAANDPKCKAWAELVLKAHVEQEPGEHGRVTLAVCNTVDDASLLYAAIRHRAKDRSTELKLIHSRFRGLERAGWSETFLRRAACTKGADRIIVATQVVEAGVDISAGVVVTQLAPWSSLVQRFGRCARYGGSGCVVVVDRKLSEKRCAPYDAGELEAAADALGDLGEVGLAALEEFEGELESSDPERLIRLYPFEPLHVLQAQDFQDLFDTEADLTGEDLDVSRFIREGDERDLSVFWWPVAADGPPEAGLQPTRDGLCPVPVGRADKWLFNSGRLKEGVRAWCWDYIDAAWQRLRRTDLRPGQLVLVDLAVGGYHPELGFTGKPLASSAGLMVEGTTKALTQAERAELGPAHEELSAYPYKTIATHGREAAEQAERLASVLGLCDELVRALCLAAALHDVGKCHPVFVNACRPEKRDPAMRERTDLAKAPPAVWATGRDLFVAPDGRPRPGFRHELASTLMLFEWLRLIRPEHPALLGPYVQLIEEGIVPAPDAQPSGVSVGQTLASVMSSLSVSAFNLIAYLICSHHGKVRGIWSATPQDQDTTVRSAGCTPIRGVVDGDRTPSLMVSIPKARQELQPGIELSLDPARLGLSGRYGASWRERVNSLIDEHGPATLAFLETCLRVADVRASRLDTGDPLLSAGVER